MDSNVLAHFIEAVEGYPDIAFIFAQCSEFFCVRWNEGDRKPRGRFLSNVIIGCDVMYVVFLFN